MNFSTARSERITAIVSTLVAVAILTGGVTAYQSHNEPVEDIVQLESDLRFQLEIAFRHDPNERTRRLAQLEQVSQAWQQSPREAADHSDLASWLLEATIRSMPGSIKALPGVPKFGERQQPSKQPTPDVLVTPPVAAEKLDLVTQVPTPSAVNSTPVAQPSKVDVRSTVVVENRTFSEQLSVAPATPLPSAAAVTQAAEPVPINLTELAARVAGYHNGLREVEAALLTLDADDFSALTDQIGQLSELTRDFRFVNLYYQALTDQERQTISAPRPLTATLAEIRRRLDSSETAQSGDFLDEFDASNQARIAELREQLAEVASRVER